MTVFESVTRSSRRPPTLAAGDIWTDPLPAAGARQAHIRDGIVRCVAEGRLRPGARLPSSRDAATWLGVSRLTVVMAYEQLAMTGLLVFRRGAGSYVAKNAGRMERENDYKFQNVG